MGKMMINVKALYPWFLFIFLGIFAWGTSFFWIKIALEEITPIEVVAWRMTFGAVFIWIFILITKRPIPSLNKEYLFNTFIYGMAMMGIPVTLITWSEIYIPSSVAGLLNSLTPLMTMVIAMSDGVNRDEVTKRRVIGMLIGFFGVFLIFYNRLSFGDFTGTFFAQAAVVVATFFYAYATLYGKMKFGTTGVVVTAGFALSFSAILLWILAFILYGEQIFIPQIINTWVSVAWMGIICSGLALIAYLTLIRTLGAAVTSCVAYLFPLTAYFLGVILLNETVSIFELIGGVTIMVGIYIARK
jgi:drug/metabolite transporter (DMT)-like permease